MRIISGFNSSTLRSTPRVAPDSSWPTPPPTPAPPSRKSGKLIESRAVDVMVAVGPNMFYTVTLPCTLWFLDRGKSGTDRADTVLFVDARHIYRQVDRAHREWTPAQIGFLANLVRLYRGEAPDYTQGGDEARAKLE
ncbi:MAG: N-6 DNA methylase [Terrimicrobiaceae bacterium]